MPDRDTTESRRIRHILYGAVGALALIVIVLSVIGFSLRDRVRTLEERDRQEAVATSTAEVAACYAAARSRPRLITILRLLASTAERDPVGLAAVESFIMDYEISTPTVAACDRRARAEGFDPKDFPPINRGEMANR